MSAMDDTTERWLIQKDRLDFGPFSMREVRSQIEAGKILGEHTITDTESGEKRRVKDHPQLRDLVLDAEMKHAEKVRLEAEADERRRHKGRIVSLLAIITLAIAGAGGGIFWYEKKTSEAKVERERKEAELMAAKIKADEMNLDFLKGVQISMKVDPPTKKTIRRPKKGGKPGEFEEVTNLGDASSEGGDETLGQEVVQRVMTQNFKVLVGCIADERRRNPGMKEVDMDFIIKGTGLVSAVKVNGQTGTPIAGCMYGKMQSVAFPKFNGAKTHASFSLALK